MSNFLSLRSTSLYQVQSVLGSGH